MVKLQDQAPSALSEGPPLLNPQQPPIASSIPIITSNRKRSQEGIQSLSKKIDRGSSNFGTQKTDEAAEKIIREILSNSQTASTRPNGVDIRDFSGRGVRITDGLFDTFLETFGTSF